MFYLLNPCTPDDPVSNSIPLSVILSSLYLCRLSACPGTLLVLSLLWDRVVQLSGIRTVSLSTRDPILTERVTVSQGSSSRAGIHPQKSAHFPYECQWMYVQMFFFQKSYLQFSSLAQGKWKSWEQQEEPLVKRIWSGGNQAGPHNVLAEMEGDPRAGIHISGTAKLTPQIKGRSSFCIIQCYCLLHLATKSVWKIQMSCFIEFRSVGTIHGQNDLR